MDPMRRIAALALLALSACGPATPPASAPPPAIPTASGDAEATAQVVGSGDGFTVSTSAESRTLTHEVMAPVDRVWQVLPDVYRELSISATANAGTRTVSTPSAVSFTRRMLGEPATRFFDCGRGQYGTDIASTHTLYLTIRTTVQPGETPGSAKLETSTQAYARNNSGANSMMSQCLTRGVLEGLIALRVREKLSS
jgi:hypothetical protein